MKRNKRIKKDGPNDLEKQVMRSMSRRGMPKLSIGYETEKLPYVLVKNYLPDFVVVKANGRKLYVESKGWFRPEDRTKMAAVKKANPDADIRMIFPSDNKINKHTSTRYSDWCRKNGFPYHIGVAVPKEWLT